MTKASPLIGSARQLRLALDKAPSYSREDFVVSPSNQIAIDALDAWPRWPGGKLALVGPPGSGKTHLARAWAAKVGAVSPALGVGGAPEPSAAAILLEDADRPIDEDTLFHLMNMADAGASLLITCRASPATWPTRLADLRSRLNALTVAPIEAPDDAVLLGVMNKLFSERNIKPGVGVAAYILTRIERSAPAVQEIVRRIDEFAGAEGREITRSLVSRIVQGGEETLDTAG